MTDYFNRALIVINVT